MTPDRSDATATERGPIETWILDHTAPFLHAQALDSLLIVAQQQDAIQRDMLAALEHVTGAERFLPDTCDRCANAIAVVARVKGEQP